MSAHVEGVTTWVALIQLVGDLAWPAFALYAVYAFRTPVTELLKRLASFKVGSNELHFQQPTEDSAASLSRNAAPVVELGADGFLKVSSIHSFVTESGLLDKGEKITAELLIFQTPKQKTWLVSTDNFVFVLLDSEETRGKLNVVQTLFAKQATLPLEFSAQDGAGSVKFAAERTWWYYSLHLFPTTSSLSDSVRNLIK
ncbi:hypothetical protein ABE485_06165 [Achromobacter spanius]|uniref:hypothetical protein n=1 Tax=Achromobacter spanius TaxID=217203 RepID=UPI0032079CC0